MRFLILNTDYPEFLRGLYAQHPGLEKQPYEEQMQARVESLFGVADSMTSWQRRSSTTNRMYCSIRRWMPFVLASCGR